MLIISTILAHWRQTYFRPSKPLPQDVSHSRLPVAPYLQRRGRTFGVCYWKLLSHACSSASRIFSTSARIREVCQVVWASLVVVQVGSTLGWTLNWAFFVLLLVLEAL